MEEKEQVPVEKEGKGKNRLIILVITIVLLFGAYVVFNMITSSDEETNDADSAINNNDDNNDNEKNNDKFDAADMMGEFAWLDETYDPGDCEGFVGIDLFAIHLDLRTDMTFFLNVGWSCTAGEAALGTYTVDNNVVYLTPTMKDSFGEVIEINNLLSMSLTIVDQSTINLNPNVEHSDAFSDKPYILKRK